MTAVLGGGISGLSVAYYALNNPKIAPLIIYEGSNRVGGWIRSLKQPDGTIFEKGPRIIRGDARVVLDLVEELDLSNKIISIKSNTPRVRYIYMNDAFHCLPSNLRGFFSKSTILNRSLSSVIWKDLITAKVPKEDESVHDFIQRRFSKDLSEKIVAPIFCGIYAGDICELSAKSCMTSIFKAEQTHGSILKGFIYNKMSEIFQKEKEIKSEVRYNAQKGTKLDNTSSLLSRKAMIERWSIWGLEGGFEQLPQVLAKNITERGVKIRMQQTCEKLIFNKDCVELIVNGRMEKHSRIISCLPAKSLATLVQEQHPELSKELCSIPVVSVVVINFQFHEDFLPKNGFGVLIPPKEEIPILGVIFDSSVIRANCKSTVMTVMMGGAWFDKYFSNLSEKELLNVALKYLDEMFGLVEDPKAFHISVLKNCIPQYTIGHEQRLTRIHKYIAEHKIPLWLCGSSYKGVGISDVILSAKQTVSDIN